MIEFRTPNGQIYIRPEAVEAIENAPRHAAGVDTPASLIFTTAGSAFPVAGAPSEVRERVRVALSGESFQTRSGAWLEIVTRDDPTDLPERIARFGEEALELQQALGQTREDALALVEYVYGRPAGHPAQEMGGTMTTLAALAHTAGLDMVECGEREAARCSTPEVIAKIRRKRASRHGRGALPGIERE